MTNELNEKSQVSETISEIQDIVERVELNQTDVDTLNRAVNLLIMADCRDTFMGYDDEEPPLEKV